MTFKEQSKRKAVTFSFDDGVTQDIYFIELMNKYGLKGTFNLNSELLGRKNILTCTGPKIAQYRVAAEDVKFVYEGHEVAVHTLDHPNLVDLEDGEIIRQVEEDRKNLEDLVGYDVVGMAYPSGGVNNNDRVAKVIKENTKMQYARTISSNWKFDPQDNLYRFSPSVYFVEWGRMFDLAQKFIELETDTPQIFYIWGHSYELDFHPDFRCRLEEFFKLISGHDDIFYGTNREVLL